MSGSQGEQVWYHIEIPYLTRQKAQTARGEGARESGYDQTFLPNFTAGWCLSFSFEEQQAETL